MSDFIPVNEPLLEGNEKKYLTECIDTGWVSSEGPFVRRFEKELASYVGREHGVAVCNGTAALDVAVTALSLGVGDEVIMPTFTIISCAAAIVRSGATPVLVDCDLTGNMDVLQIEDLITSRTKAIMVVHIYGLPVNMNPVLELTQKYGLYLIEDAAEMLGQTYNGRQCGSFGDISTFSFYPNKHVTTGEGGMVLVNDSALADRCRSLRDLCFESSQRFLHSELGWNYRMSNLQAAIGVAQLERLNAFVMRKRAIGKQYSELLADVKGLQLPLATTPYSSNIYWVYGVVVDKCVDMEAKELIHVLAEHGIGSRPFFWPMHEQPVFNNMGLFTNLHMPVAENFARKGLYLPSGLALSDTQVIEVAETVRKVLKRICR